MNTGSYLMSIVFSVLLIVLGVVIIMNPAGTMAAFTLLISILMIISGITNVFLFVTLFSSLSKIQLHEAIVM